VLLIPNVEEASACQPFVKFFVGESLQDVAGGKHTPVTSTDALSTYVCLSGWLCCLCVCVEHGALCERTCTDSFWVYGNFIKVAAFCIVEAAKLFYVVIERSCFSLFTYRTLK
jgi:hypothetical protein